MPKFTQQGNVLGSCRDCNKIFFAENVKKLKIMVRLHKKVCLNTGRTIDENDQFEKKSAEIFKASTVYAISKKQKITVREEGSIDKQVHSAFPNSNFTNSNKMLKTMIKHS